MRDGAKRSTASISAQSPLTMTLRAGKRCSVTAAAVRPILILSVLLLAACANRERLASNVTTLNREIASYEDQTIFLNILRRSFGEPMHFMAVPIIRDRSTTNVGANLNFPFGPAAVQRFEINPSVSLDERLRIEVSPQSNQEFYKGILAPVTARTMSYYLRQDVPDEVVLSLMVDRIRMRSSSGDRLYRNDPEQTSTFADFQSLIRRLVEQELSTEQAELVRDLGPPIERTQAPAISDILSADKEGLRIEEITEPGNSTAGQGRLFQVREVVAGVRFCFAAPRSSLFGQARCSSAIAQPPRYKLGHPHLFSNMDGSVAVFETSQGDRIEIHTRSLSEMFDYIGELVRVQEAGELAPLVQTSDGPSRLFVVNSRLGPGSNMAPSIVSVYHGGRHYSVPAGEEGGWSGEVLSIMTELLAQAQSVSDLPFSNRLTILRD